MATKRSDNDDERFARIDALMEEYRLKHADLEAYLQKARELAQASRERSRQSLATANAGRTRSNKR